MRATPRGIAVLLKALPSDLRETVAGDLDEEYVGQRRRRGRLRADLWVWATAGRLAVRFHLERLTHTRGVPPLAEEIRSRISMWDTLRQDIVFSLRMLRRQPGFTAVAVLALALGIGANTAIFSIVDAVLWRPLPYADADRVMAIAEQRPREGRAYGAVSPADFFDWRAEAHSFSAMAAINTTVFNLTGAGEPERLSALAVSPGFLDALAISPILGRGFRLEEEIYGAHRVVLLTDGIWRRRFGADPAIVGQTITFDGRGYLVTGVLPASYWWPTATDVLVPLALDDHDRTLRSAHFLDVVGRLRPGVSVAQAREELNVIGARLAQGYPDDNANHGPSLRPLRDALVADVRTALLVLLGAVGCVLLIACANVATLLLARASARQKELSVRRAVGATRGRVIQQMLTESVTLACAGGAAGVLLAVWSLAAVRGMMPAQFSELPGIERVAIDARMLATAFGASLATGLMFGLLPALAASDSRIGTVLHDESRGSSASARTQRLRAALVVVELAGSLVLLAGAALLIVSFNRLLNVSPGFRPERLVVVSPTLPYSRYGGEADAVGFYERLMERLRALPGVQHAAATSAPPFSGLDARLNLDIEHRAWDLQGPVRAHPRMVSPTYFETLGIPIIRGRGFTDRDQASSPPIAIINETAARQFWPGRDPIGQRISLGSPTRWMEIVGIAGDVRHMALNQDAEPEAFIPQRQGFRAIGDGLRRAMTIIVRTRSDGLGIVPEIRAAVAGIDPLQPIGRVRTMDEMMADVVAPRRLNFVLVSAFAFVAVVLTAAGLYGVMSYLVAQRTREIGVRMALGASRAQVMAMMFRQAGIMTFLGIGLGIGGALFLTRSMTSLLFGVTAADPAIYAVVSLLLALIAALAVAVPSNRASRVDPLVALRDS